MNRRKRLKFWNADESDDSLPRAVMDELAGRSRLREGLASRPLSRDGVMLATVEQRFGTTPAQPC
ncbi:hypothetical protein [Paraburkholderia ferrariae]|uniref:hypothetical protein n=1 Tax=Paraburkholderia ferrariae TaxID=386056 RepID=UPI0012EBD239|nr:hypothetical protein [Paraburkholderia ferrariae]